MYHCEKCHKDFRWSGDFETEHTKNLKLIDPDIDKICDECGGNIIVGFYQEPCYGICGGGDLEIHNVALGCSPEQIPEMIEKYPGSEYDNEGNLVTKGYAAQVKAARQRGMYVK